MIIYIIRWILTLILAFLAGKLVTKIRMPSILGWLIVGILFGPHAIGLLIPVVIGGIVGFLAGIVLKKSNGKAQVLITLVAGITLTAFLGSLVNTILSGITLNYMLMGVSFSAVFANMVSNEQHEKITDWFHPILALSLLAAIVDLGCPT